jgi:hypothetical protein
MKLGDAILVARAVGRAWPLRQLIEKSMKSKKLRNK